MSTAEPGDRPRLLDAVAVALGAAHDGVAWSASSDQLHLNVVRFGPGAGVAEHVNDEVDVAGVVIAGEVRLRLPDGEHRLGAGAVFFIPRHTMRAFRAGGQGCSYVTCHRRRSGLMPARPPA
jgi:quercetin dioxygenase-like cupin family protein